MSQLTAEQVYEIIGRQTVGEHQLREIIETGATEAELLEAFQRASRSDVGMETRRAPGPRVERLIEILALDEEQWEED